MNATPEQKKAALAMVFAVSEAIRELGTVPSGHLYAQLMGKISLRDYNAIIDVLKRSKLVEEKNYELTWIGPRIN